MTWFLILVTLVTLWLAFNASRMLRRWRTRRLLNRFCKPRYLP